MFRGHRLFLNHIHLEVSGLKRVNLACTTMSHNSLVALMLYVTVNNVSVMLAQY